VAPSGRERGYPVAIHINDDSMVLEIDGKIIATATRVGGHEWTVEPWPRYFDRNQAITALTVAERLTEGYGEDDPFVIAWREELAP
jgi:hypothetical protein